MGAVNFSLDPGLVLLLKHELPLSIFVETGSFEGDTVQSVRPLFDRIYTVELVEKYFQKVFERFKDDPSITARFQSSPEFLRQLKPSLENASVLYWLDAHWCMEGETEGKESQCPLIEELEAIGHLNTESVILIDDARLFLGPPPPPYESSQWPVFSDILSKLIMLNSLHELMVINDVMVFYPRSSRESIKQYAIGKSVDWLNVFDKSRDYDVLLQQLTCKEEEIQQTKWKEEKIQQQHGDIMTLLGEIRKLRRSNYYRLGFFLLNPWRAVHELFRSSSSGSGDSQL